MGSEKQQIAGLAVVVAIALLGCACDASPLFHYPSVPRQSPAPGYSPLSDDYYKGKCYGHDVELIVKDVVYKALSEPYGRGTGAGLIRLFFHDCFVQGCDGSVLLDPTSANPKPEKEGVPNRNSLRGFEVIDAIKTALNDKCGNIVSCADILAFAARDATVFLSNGRVSNFKMPAGRYDGKVSLADETIPNLPPPFANLDTLKAMFKTKGLDTEEMVTLSGAHTIGISRCSSFGDRINASSPSNMDSGLADELRAKCNNQPDVTVDQDFVTPVDLDRQYYKNVLKKKVLFQSDAALLSSGETFGQVWVNANWPGVWEYKFKAAMVKMGNIEVKTKDNGEIRKQCRFINY